MQTIKAIKQRIKSTQSVIKVTRVVQLIAASKLKSARDRTECGKHFYKCIQRQLHHINTLIKSKVSFDKRKLGKLFSKSSSDQIVSLVLRCLVGRILDNQKKLCITVVTSSKGLCGSLNSAVVKLVKTKVKEYINNTGSENGSNITIVCIGAKAYPALKNILPSGVRFINKPEWYSYKYVTKDIMEMAASLCQVVNETGASDFQIVFSRFKNLLTQEASIISVFDEIKNTSIENNENEHNKSGMGTLSEPLHDCKEEELFEMIARQFAVALLNDILFSHIASEHALKMTSMDAATKNGEKLARKLILQSNKIRQSAITGELIDIVSGSGAAVSE